MTAVDAQRRDVLLTPAEVAERCRLSIKTVYRAIERGELAACRICSRIRVRESSVDAWIDACSVVTDRDRLDRIPRLAPAPSGSLRAMLAAKGAAR